MKKTASLAHIALFAALISVCAWISLPITPPVTLQTLAIFLAAGLMSTKKSLAAVLCYILLGAMGAPVFAGFQGGLSTILSPVGGYILGFVFIPLSVGLTAGLIKNKTAAFAAGCALGTLLCYLVGTLWFAFLFPPQSGLSLAAILLSCVLPFILPDILKIALAVLLVKRLSKVLER